MVVETEGWVWIIIMRIGRGALEVLNEFVYLGVVIVRILDVGKKRFKIV